MNNTKTTPPHFLDRFNLRVPFNVNGHIRLIETLSEQDVIVRVDSNCQTACACFDNEEGYNALREKLGIIPPQKIGVVVA